MILLNPGPVTLSERVRTALAGPDLCHREPEYAELQTRVRAGLSAVYALDATEWTSLLLTGSGTAAVEAMLASLVPADGRLVTVENGVYGERMTRMARAHGIDVVAVPHAWDAAIDLDALDTALAGAPRPASVAVVHHETTTGRRNDLAAVGAVCRRHGARLLVDAVSSFAGEPLEFEAWGVHACAATANKCLHGAPGMAFVILRRGLLADAPTPGRTLYLDLAGHARAQETESTAFTPAVPALYALDAALAELSEQGGWPARHARYAALAERVRVGLARAGIRPYLDPGVCSVVLRSYALQSGQDYARLHDGLKARGFIVYAGQGELADTLFRVSTMGAITDADVTALIDAVHDIAGARADGGSAAPASDRGAT